MRIKIGRFDYSEVWDGVFYKKLSEYPHISPWEMRTLIEFAAYEKDNGRDCEILCEDDDLRKKIEAGMRHPETYLTAKKPDKITECTACRQKGCETAFVCHTTSAENAVSILQGGKILSAVKARNLPAEVLARESRNAAQDPPDYFHYVMFSWGNCQAGDRLATERRLGRFPNEEDLGPRFRPGIRFYFRYDDLAGHPNRAFDGVLPLKIKDEITLSDWVYRIIIPTQEKSSVGPWIPADLRDRVRYIENDGCDLWEWSEKVYETVKNG